MSLTSDEVNYLVYRYLQESGFTHSTFSFAHESHIVKSDLKNVNISPGALINLLQKGLLYAEAEASINELSEVDSSKTAARKKQEKLRRKRKEIEMMDIDDSRKEITASHVLALQGHESEVFNTRWHPSDERLLLSGAGDSTARLWRIPAGSIDSKTPIPSPVILEHKDNSEFKDVTAIQWSRSGDILATGTYNGWVRLWKNGESEAFAGQQKHKGPVFAVSWNGSSSKIISCSVDKTIIVWSADTLELPCWTSTGEMRRYLHPALQIKQFALNKLGNKDPLKKFETHIGEVNKVSWSADGKYLASCSDDKTAKVWSVDADGPVADFKGHTKEIYTIEWSPTGPGTKNPDSPLVLATASFDNTVRLWDVETSKCVRELRQHTQPIYSVSFRPDGKYVASGSWDGKVIVWKVDDGSIVKIYRGNSGIFELSWNENGTKIAAAFSKNMVAVFDFATN